VRLRFAQLGAFLDVRLWHLTADGDDVVLVEPGSRVRHSARELIDPAGRRLVLLLSDCVSPLWRLPRTAQVVRAWAAGGPVAILQPLPEHMWSRTGLTLRRGLLRSPAPGSPNTRLEFTPRTGPAVTGVPVPVLEVEPDWMLPWARMLGMGGGDPVESVVAMFGAAELPPADPSPAVVSGDERVLRFRAAASPEAYRLAGYLAAAPLTLATMTTVQAAMMPGSRPSLLAEVLYGGIVRPAAEGGGGDQVFDFTSQDVRQLLLGTLRRSEASAVLGVVSAYLESRPDTARNRLTGAVPGSGMLAYDGDARVFAEVRGQVLRRLGRGAGPVARSDAVRCLSRLGPQEDSQWLACGRESGVVQVWDPLTDRPERERRLGHGAVLCVTSLALAGGREMVVAGCSDGFVVVWDPRADEVVQQWAAHRGAVWSICSIGRPVGDAVVTSGADAAVVSWDLTSGEPRRDWALSERGAETLAMARDRDGVYLGRRDGSLWWADVHGDRAVSMDRTRAAQVNAVAAAATATGWTVAFGGGDGRVLIRVPGGKVVTCRGHGGLVNALAVVPLREDEVAFASAGSDAEIRLWDQRGEALGVMPSGHRSGVTALVSVRFSGQELLASAGLDGAVVLHRPVAGRPASDLLTGFGALRVRPGRPADRGDGVIPRFVATPGHDAEVARLMTAAASRELTVRSRGSGSKEGWGRRPDRVDLQIETGLLRIMRPPRDGTVLLGAGLSVRVVQERLARQGLRLAVDPPSPTATIGGMLAVNESGPLAQRHGTPVEQTLNIRYVDATGRVRDAGRGDGRPDEGGVITSAVMRVHPLPAARRWVVCPVATAQQVTALAAEAVPDDMGAAAIEVNLPAVGPGEVAVLLEGDPDPVAAAADLIRASWGRSATGSGSPPAWWGEYPFAAGDVALRIAVRREDLPAAVYAVRDAARGPVPLRGSAGLGLVHAVLPSRMGAERIRQVVAVLREVMLARPMRVDVVAARRDPPGELF
jgi:glycolate oxidase FAD binding subunit